MPDLENGLPHSTFTDFTSKFIASANRDTEIVLLAMTHRGHSQTKVFLTVRDEFLYLFWNMINCIMQIKFPAYVQHVI